MFVNVIDEFLIFLWGPRTLLESILFSRGLGHGEEDGVVTKSSSGEEWLWFVPQNE